MKRIAVLATLSLAACADKPGATAPTAAPVAEAPAPVPEKTVIEVPAFTISSAPGDIAKGQELFAAKGCPACHKIGGGKLVGPDLKGVTARRDETWLKKMILRPDVMIKEDETAKQLFVAHLTPMPNQGVDPKIELPLILAYLKSVEK
jgi:mono/diheme cytochrome c family protein